MGRRPNIRRPEPRGFESAHAYPELILATDGDGPPAQAALGEPDDSATGPASTTPAADRRAPTPASTAPAVAGPDPGSAGPEPGPASLDPEPRGPGSGTDRENGSGTYRENEDEMATSALTPRDVSQPANGSPLHPGGGSSTPVEPPPPPPAPVPGPPDGILDLAALATLDGRLRSRAAALIEAGVRAGLRSPGDARRDRAAVASASSVATVLWFDALRAEDRVSVTPHTAPLLLAVHEALGETQPPSPDALAVAPPAATAALPWETQTAAVAGPGRPLRRLGSGNVGPSGTVWAALAHRFAGSRFDHTPGGRQICLIDFTELRDPSVWESITDERVAHLGELFWVVLVSGTGISDGWQPGATGAARESGGVGGPGRAARMFEAAGWQVLTVRHGRRLGALSRAPGGPALMARLDQLTPAQYQELLHTRGAELRRRLAGPGAAGVGISRLLDTLPDEEILACLRDLGGHDIPLLIDAFDEVAGDRPTVLFAYTDNRLTPDDAPPTSPDDLDDPDRPAALDRPDDVDHPDDVVTELDRPGDQARPEHPAHAADIEPADIEPAAAVAGGRNQEGRTAAGPLLAPVPWTPGARRLARHVGTYLDRAPIAPRAAAPVPGHVDRRADGVSSTQEALGQLLRDLPALAPQAATAVVTVSTRAADPILANWLAAAGRHVAGGLSAPAFGGVLASLGVAWSRQGLPLLPIGVADELAAGQVLPGWLAAGSGDARSMLAVADTGLDPASRALAFGGGDGVPERVAAVWTPAFAQDLAWCLLAGLGQLGRPGGVSSLLRLSARPIDQRLAALPSDPVALRQRHALALAGGYRLYEGGPDAVLTLVGVGAVLPEVLGAAARLCAGLRREVSVVCLTSPNAVFAALQARRGLQDGSDALLGEILPARRRTPLVTVVDGDPRSLAFLAGVHGDPIATLGSAAPAPGTEPPGPGDAPVPLETIIGAALDLLDETSGR